MTDQPRASFMSDQPAQSDGLGFTPYRQTLAQFIEHADAETDTPMTIGVFGAWGAGKTTLLRWVKEDVESAGYISVWFTAWKYSKEDTLWRALLLSVVGKVREILEKEDNDGSKEYKDKIKALGELDQVLYHAIDRVEFGGPQIDWVSVGTGIAQAAVQVLVSSIPFLSLASGVGGALQEDAAKSGLGRMLDAFKREHKDVHIAQVKSLEQFDRRLKDVIKKYVSPRKLVVFVDDLDRCLAEKAVDVLEAIKLFLDVEGCVFVLGMARDVITNGISIKYGELGEYIDGERYLEKIIQVPFELPPLERNGVRDYVKSLSPGLPDKCQQVLAVGLVQPNPRRIKRMINSFLFLSRLAQACRDRLGDLDDVRLAKIVAIQHGDPALFGLLRLAPRYLPLLDAFYQRASQRDRDVAGGEERDRDPEADGLPESLRNYAGHQGLRRLLGLYAGDDALCFAGLDEADVRPYFSLTRSVAAPDEGSVAAAPYVPDLVAIPGGTFTMGTSDDEIRALMDSPDWVKEWREKGFFEDEQPAHPVTLSDYWIGRAPVTNLQYQAFVQASDDHAPPRHWNGAVAPDDIRDHPVIYVNYDDAVAYCDWLTKRTGRSFRLPTEAEWERAARGKEGYRYPWGDKWDASRCNTSEGGAGGTTPAGHYSPQGDNSFRCQDMAGNVWEWCLDGYGPYADANEAAVDPVGLDRGDGRVVRGGSWSRDRRAARCAYRLRGFPNDRFNNIGFRVVVAPPISQRF